MTVPDEVREVLEQEAARRIASDGEDADYALAWAGLAVDTVLAHLEEVAVNYYRFRMTRDEENS